MFSNNKHKENKIFLKNKLILKNYAKLSRKSHVVMFGLPTFIPTGDMWHATQKS